MLHDLGYPEFQDSMPTVRFLLVVDEVFDMLNSRNPIAKGSKAPISAENKDKVVARLRDIMSYLMSLTSSSGRSIRSTRRWLSVVGIAVTSLSLIQLLPGLLEKQRFVLAYKFSQDHLELLFGCVRRLGGSNNSPTALQFAKIWRQLIRRAGVKAALNGNVRALDPTCLISVPYQDPAMTTTISADRVDITDSDTVPLLIDTEDGSMTLLVKNAVCYIAGWTAKKAEQVITCAECLAALTTSSPPSDFTETYCLIKKKNYDEDGALRFPSRAVLEIAMSTERAIRACGDARASAALFARVSAAVIGTVCEKDVFSLHNHDRDTMYGIDTHSVTLVRTIVTLYYRVRQHHIARLHTQRLQAGNKRKTLNKLTLFRSH